MGGSFFLPPADQPRSPRDEALDELFEALALGVRDYFGKTGAFRSVGVAVSGGRDSLLTLLVAWHAVGKESVTAFYMPGRYSDRAMLGGAEPNALTRQNIQSASSRRAHVELGRTLPADRDMSEKAVGYTTIGGDLEGAFSVIANVPKTVVAAMLERLRARFNSKGIALTLETVPGPELAEGQAAESELISFAVLDACLHLYAGEKLTTAEIAVALQALFPEIESVRLRRGAERFVELFTRSIYKWVQAPLALHVGTLDLDRERALQLPVVQRNEWRRETES